MFEKINAFSQTATHTVKPYWKAASILTVLLFALWAPIGFRATAVHDDNLFELGGIQAADIVGDGNAANGPDWADVFDGSGNVVDLFGGPAASFIIDELSQSSAVDKTTFSGAGGSNKNNDPLSNADCAARVPPLTGSACDTWHWDTGNVPAKDDLSNVYSYATFNAEGHLILYGGFERLDPSGDSHVDIEFFQSGVSLDEDPACNDPGPDTTPCSFEGIRTVGDIVVSMDFVQGGALGEVSIHEWDGTEYILLEVIVGEGCDAADTACAFNNGGNINGGPWANFNRHGATITDIPQNGFTEFGGDITALTGGTPCLSTFMGKTRSSQSFTAELKDFAGPESLPLCGASIAIGPDDVNEVGQNHTFTVTVSKLLPGSSAPAPDGTIVDVTLTDANGAVSSISSNTCSTGTVNGTCTVTFTSETAGTVTGHASADVLVVTGLLIHVETDGTGSNSGDAVKRFVDATISITPSDVNSVGETHVFTVSVQQDGGLGAGLVAVPDGTIVTVTLTPSGGAAVSNLVDNCATGTIGGSCSVSFTSNTAGTITGHAEVTLNISGAILLRVTGAVQNPDAVKDFVSGSISWLKVDNANQLQGGATFEVCRTHNFNTDTLTFDDIPDVCVSVVDDTDGTAGPGLDEDPDAGQFLISGLRLGRYTVHETVPPPGFAADPDTVTVNLTLLSPNANIAEAFRNERPILKLTELGYVNTPTGTPTSGVVSGITTYTVRIKNFGTATASLSGTLVVTSSAGVLVCNDPDTDCDLDIIAVLAPGAEAVFTLTIEYTNFADGTVITANLNADYTIDSFSRTVSGTPASITFTVQSD